LHGVDVVDEGAATDGLFGIKSAEFATIATDFLDNNERLWELIEANPAVVEQFMARYKARHERNNEPEETEMLDNQTINETNENADEAVELSTEGRTDTETFTAESAEVVEVQEQPVGFKELYDAYGPAFAEYAFEEKLTAAEAKDAYLAHMQDRVADLEMQLAESVEIGEEEPAEFAAVSTDEENKAASVDKRAAELERNGVSRGVARFAASLNLNNE